MKKFTIYEIEKYTNGTLSRYKIKKAIKKGLLKTIKNNGKVVVDENELTRFLHEIGDQKQKTVKKEPTNQESGAVDVNHHKEVIGLLREKISDLEKDRDRVLSSNNLLKDGKDNEAKMGRERVSLWAELGRVSRFRFFRRRKIMKRLDEIM